MAKRRVFVSLFPRLELSAFVVIDLRSSQKLRKYLTVKPSTPGLESGFIVLKRLYVSSLVVRSPSICRDWFRVSFLLLSSFRGSVSLSELRKSSSAFWDVSKFGCSL